MPDKEQHDQNDFMVEKIKVRPINRKKLIRRTIITAAMAVIFGLVACFTFLVLEPVISNWLYPAEEEPQMVIFPEDQEEMSPEDMLAEKLPQENPVPSAGPAEGTSDDEQLRQLLDGLSLNSGNYAQLYASLYDLIYKGNGETPALSQYMVTVRGISSNIDWFDDVQESSNQASGVIVADNGREFLILVEYTALQKAESLVLDLGDGYSTVEARLKGLDPETNLAIAAVSRSDIPEQLMGTDGLAVAPMGSSVGDQLAGTPVIAMGSPMGVGDSIGYGIITSTGLQLSSPDRTYKLLLTDISGSKNAEGVLFNLQGQVVGVITGNKTDGDMENLINAYGITEIKRIIEKLSNESAFAYLGISGVDVTSDVHRDLGVPYGAYVTKLEMDSPAMLAGVQVGDVITAMDDSALQSFSAYSTALMQKEPGQTVKLTVMRQAQEDYREMSFFIELGERTD